MTAALRFLERFPILLALAVCALGGAVAWARIAGMSAEPLILALSVTAALLVAAIIYAATQLQPEDHGSTRGRR